MSTQSRLDKAEKRLNPQGTADASEWCTCPGPVTVKVNWDPEPETPEPETCPRCGRPIRHITIDWDEPTMEPEGWD